MADAAAPFVVLDAAVLLEAGWNKEVDRIVYVDAPREVRIARLAARSGWTEADLAAREAAQWPEEVKKSRADAVIVNDAGLSELQKSGGLPLLKSNGVYSPVSAASEKRR